MSHSEKENNSAEKVWSVVSHDLKTPLFIINTDAKCLQKDLLPILLDAYKKAQIAGLEITPIRPDRLKKYQAYLPSIQSTVERIGQYVSRMDRKICYKNYEAASTLKPTPIVDCINEAVSKYQAKYTLEDKSRIQITLDDANVLGNPEMIQYMIYELLANAEYAIEENRSDLHLGSVIITGQKKQDSYVLQIKNNGKPIPENDMPHLFDSYFTTRSGSLGIGLSFCKQAIEAMSGEITCFTSDDRYTCFSINFQIQAT